MARLFNDGKAVVETNHVDAVRTGSIKAQYPLAGEVNAENGMLLVVDDVAKEVSFPAAAGDKVMLHDSEERIYEYHLGRKSFEVKAGDYPRMMKLAVGDIFETNAVDDGDFNDLAAVIAQIDDEDERVFGIPSTSGLIELKEDTDGSDGDLDLTAYEVVLEVVEMVTLPNEHTGIKFVVIQA